MKLLIKNVLLFSFFFSLVTLVLLIGTTVLKRSVVDINIAADKRILIVGDSHTECAVNDEKIDGALNLSRGGSGYFYTYIKVREMLDLNDNIDIVVLGYSYSDLLQKREEWFSSSDSIKFKMPEHFFMFDNGDFLSLLAANPFGVLIYLPRTYIKQLWFSVKSIASGPNESLSELGGYLSLTERNISPPVDGSDSEIKEQDQYSAHQEEYLLRIYDLVTSQGKKIILVNTPIYSDLNKKLRVHEERYNEVANRMPSAILLNHADYELPDLAFADDEHLNYEGALLYSEFLVSQGLFSADL